MNTCMTERNVLDHYVKMMGHINTTEVISSLHVVESCLVENYNDKWIINLGTTNHVCYSFEWFKQSIPLRKGKRRLKLGNREYVSIMVVGLVKL